MEQSTEPSAAIAETVQDWALLVTHDLEQQSISWQRFLADGALYEIAAGHATYRVMRILAGLNDILYEVTSAAHAEDYRLGIRGSFAPP